MEYKVNIGGIVIRIKSNYYFGISEEYKKFLVEEENSSIEINVLLKESHYSFVPRALLNTEISDTHRWISISGSHVMYFGRRGIALEQEDKDHIWYLICNKNFSKCVLLVDDFNNWKELYDRPWIQRLYCAYIGLMDKVVMHGACVVKDNIGILLLGDSGKGKSTACRLLKEEHFLPISDDRIVIEKNSEGIYCYGTPWNRKNPDMSKNRRIKLKKILFLNHGQNLNSYMCISSLREFYLLFSKQIINSSQFETKDLIIGGINMTIAVFEKIDCFSLWFTPNDTFVHFIKTQLLL